MYADLKSTAEEMLSLARNNQSNLQSQLLSGKSGGFCIYLKTELDRIELEEDYQSATARIIQIVSEVLVRQEQRKRIGTYEDFRSMPSTSSTPNCSSINVDYEVNYPTAATASQLQVEVGTERQQLGGDAISPKETTATLAPKTSTPNFIILDDVLLPPSSTKGNVTDPLLMAMQGIFDD